MELRGFLISCATPAARELIEVRCRLLATSCSNSRIWVTSRISRILPAEDSSSVNSAATVSHLRFSSRDVMTSTSRSSKPPFSGNSANKSCKGTGRAALSSPPNSSGQNKRRMSCAFSLQLITFPASSKAIRPMGMFLTKVSENARMRESVLRVRR
ncbi:MAG: hypothetical protein BWY90_01707 [Deltaproteobacteria bacterium ADurb.BinA014]|nr:MAG: hypothetical protein BWY90_01707 [Deltaproteobacteria bacterium ADurb.BinA014]